MGGIVSAKSVVIRRNELWAKNYNCDKTNLITKKGGTISWQFKQRIIKPIIAKNAIGH